jgi:hypothetical protein
VSPPWFGVSDFRLVSFSDYDPYHEFVTVSDEQTVFGDRWVVAPDVLA